MPSTVEMWATGHAEMILDQLENFEGAYRLADLNPLGSAAGYGNSFPLNRSLTTQLLGFDSMDYNVVYAQMGRGKTERIVASALASVAGTISKLAFDSCMYTSQNFGFLKLADQFTTGSSIMPHKKNPDVFELTRAKCNKLQGIPQQITMIINNLPSGYFRDLQIIKEVYLPMFDEMIDILVMTRSMIEQVEVNETILNDSKYDLIFSVEEVNKRTLAGTPFRDAYKQVGLEIEAGNFTPDKNIAHTHEGSIGNLCNEQIKGLMQDVLSGFNFSKVEAAQANLLK
jgi:argininosuccinate lyase